jgi:hypothetical protein
MEWRYDGVGNSAFGATTKGNTEQRTNSESGPSESAGHISDDDLERYVFGRVQEPELATLEHILACAACAEQAQECVAWVEAIRAAAVRAERV